MTISSKVFPLSIEGVGAEAVVVVVVVVFVVSAFDVEGFRLEEEVSAGFAPKREEGAGVALGAVVEEVVVVVEVVAAGAPNEKEGAEVAGAIRRRRIGEKLSVSIRVRNESDSCAYPGYWSKRERLQAWPQKEKERELSRLTK